MVWALLGSALAFLAAGLGVILTQGQSTWVPSNHWLAPSLFTIGVLLLFWWLIRALRLRAAEPDEVVPNRRVDQETHGSHSPAINIRSGTVNVNYGPDPVSSTESSPGLAPKVSKARLDYKARRTRVEFVPEELWFTEKLPGGTMAALVAFRNRSAVTAKNVTAAIEFDAGIDSQSVFHGCWLDTSFSSIWIEPSMTKHLVVAVYSSGEDRFFTFDSQQHQVGDHKEPIARSLGRHLHNVSITLGINGEDEKFFFVLDLETEFRFDFVPPETGAPSVLQTLRASSPSEMNQRDQRPYSPKLEFGPYIYAGDWSLDEFRRPQVIDVKNTQIATSNSAKNVTARIEYTHADGTSFTLTEAPWFVREDDGELEVSGIRSSVSLVGDESQPFALLQICKDGTPAAYRRLVDLVGICGTGHWLARIRIMSDNANSIEAAVGFTVLANKALIYDQPAFVSRATTVNT